MIQINTLKDYENIKDYYYCDEEGGIWSNWSGQLEPKGQHMGSTGYLQTTLRTKQGGDKTLTVHKIIITAYKENPDPTVYTDVNHINHIKTDNRIENLEWQDRWGNTSGDPVWKQIHAEACAKALSKPVLLIDEVAGYSITFLSQKQCAEYLGVTPDAISKAIKNGHKCKDRYTIKPIKTG